MNTKGLMNYNWLKNDQFTHKKLCILFMILGKGAVPNFTLTMQKKEKAP